MMAKPLMEVLGEIRGGAAINDAAKDFLDLCQRVRDVGKPGELTIKIKVNPDKNDPDVYEVVPDAYISKMPRKPRAKGLFYMTTDGRLVREDPKQAKMEFDGDEEGKIARLGQVGRGTTGSG
jgi:hypothetical protein